MSSRVTVAETLIVVAIVINGETHRRCAALPIELSERTVRSALHGGSSAGQLKEDECADQYETEDAGDFIIVASDQLVVHSDPGLTYL